MIQCRSSCSSGSYASCNQGNLHSKYSSRIPYYDTSNVQGGIVSGPLEREIEAGGRKTPTRASKISCKENKALQDRPWKSVTRMRLRTVR
jgi:hypothetical protein